MQTWARYSLVILVILIFLHSILSLSHEEYSRATSLSSIIGGGKKYEAPLVPSEYYFPLDATNATLAVDRRANATFVILARNSDINGAIRSVRDIEDRFNRARGYPYVFLNEMPFTEEFKKRVSVLSASKMEFGLIPRDHWFQPDWIDEKKAAASRNKMEEEKIIYGGSVSYRNMCRFNSGFFFKHELLQKYRWYWRIEPEVHFHCDLSFDPFLFMEDHNKTYGWTITMYEFEKTIPTLWGHVKEFMRLHPEYVAKDNAMGFMSLDGGDSFNLCHFWSNFEIADMDFWRGEAYTAFFNYLDSQGGFYYERWGDAPVHSIAAAIFLDKDRLHFFDEIGYEHNPYTHCPKRQESWERGRCSCDPDKSFDYDGYSCMKYWDNFINGGR
ncbi:putative mannosyltransferase MNT2 [Termitomyces sp. T112]|nr:putative mannosyltransferase MNT2 [Termitomyces sp. T112]